MIPRTHEEILAAVSVKIQDDWGVTPLIDPVANRADNLVRLVSAITFGQAELESRFEAFLNRDNIPYLEGVMLDAAGARMGVFRKVGTHSKAVVIVTGADGSVFPEGEELLDRFGGKWVTESDIHLSTSGGFAFGYGVACAEDAGNQTLYEKELTYDNSITPWIHAATNGIMLETGGEHESDEAFRNRLLNRGPMAHINGTVDAAMSAIYAVDGVNFGRYAKVETCDCAGWMFVVHGGSDTGICDALRLNVGLGACSLVGATECLAHCADVRFQRPCPVLVKIRVTTSCDCPLPNQGEIESLILAEAPRIARQQKVLAKELERLHFGIEKVEIAAMRMPLNACPQEADTIIDPISGEEIIWGTSQTQGVCAGVISCAPEYAQKIMLSHWQFPVIDGNHIEIVRDCDKPTDSACNECSS